MRQHNHGRAAHDPYARRDTYNNDPYLVQTDARIPYHPLPYRTEAPSDPYYYAPPQPQVYVAQDAVQRHVYDQRPLPCYGQLPYTETQWNPPYSHRNAQYSHPSGPRNQDQRQRAPISHNDMHWRCEPCEKSFPLQKLYLRHCKTHVRCSSSGCDFEACKRVVNAHHDTQHGKFSGDGFKKIKIEGQKFTVLVGNKPEDIIKWREERRKRWPSKTDPPKLVDKDLNKEDGELEEAESQHTAVNTNSDAKEADVSRESDKRTDLCRKFIRGQCRAGELCRYSHNRGDFACTALVKGLKCTKGKKCFFSHDEELVKQAQARSLSKRNHESMSNDRNSNKRICGGGENGRTSSLLQKLLQKDIDQDHAKMLEIIRFLARENILSKE